MPKILASMQILIETVQGGPWHWSFKSFLSACSVASVVSDSHPMDCSLPGSSVHWILQTRILEWVAMPSSREELPRGF